jgi:hypothetical protein
MAAQPPDAVAETEIRRLLDDFAQAFRSRDISGVECTVKALMTSPAKLLGSGPVVVNNLTRN